MVLIINSSTFAHITYPPRIGHFMLCGKAMHSPMKWDQDFAVATGTAN